MDIRCAHCGEPWDVWGLRHEGWGYLDDESDTAGLPPEVQADLAVADDHTLPESVCTVAGNRVNTWLHKAVLSGKGCPHCGFDHPGEGPHREEQLHALVIDGVDDGDPIDYM